MLLRVLEEIERLQAELAVVDPQSETDAADKVASLMAAMRAVLAAEEARRLPDMPPSLRRAEGLRMVH